VVRERGAWVRIYGVPLHVWNLDFFKLCVYDCGRLLRLDDLTLEKGRFDYARVLISTDSVDIIKTEAKVLVDGSILDFLIVEEGGFSLGEDACLSDDGESQTDVLIDHDACIDEMAEGGDVDNLLNHLAEDWKNDSSGMKVSQNSKHSVSVSKLGDLEQVGGMVPVIQVSPSVSTEVLNTEVLNTHTEYVGEGTGLAHSEVLYKHAAEHARELVEASTQKFEAMMARRFVDKVGETTDGHQKVERTLSQGVEAPSEDIRVEKNI
jgi:hypothetical protein